MSYTLIKQKELGKIEKLPGYILLEKIVQHKHQIVQCLQLL
jgi:hypothetical protein